MDTLANSRQSPQDADWVSRSEKLSFEVRNFIDGQWVAQREGPALQKYGPREGRALYRVARGDISEVNVAVESARRAFSDGRWSRLPMRRRKDALAALASLIDVHREELALLECIDVGKPISDTLNFDVPVAADIIRFNAEAIEHLGSKTFAVDQTSLSYQLHRPVGVVAAIIGWNFPLTLAVQKIGAALAAGNTMVLKPSELSSLSAARIAELAVESGIPEGVLNVIHGDGSLGAGLALHHDVDLITFTGSTSVGKQLLIAAGQSNMKRLLLECGGKAPNIVFEDCPNLVAVAEAIVARAFWNQGQVCTASSRLLVQEGVKRELLHNVMEKMAAWTPGDPLLAQTRLGSLVSRAHHDKVVSYIKSAPKEGARLLHQVEGSLPFEGGFYVRPVILDQVTPEQRVAREEIFGPVLSVMPFRTEEDAVRIANSTLYGLSAIVWTKDLGCAHRLTQGITAGSISVNATESPRGGPRFGALPVGGHKQSGNGGVEGGHAGVLEYMNHTAVQLFV